MTLAASSTARRAQAPLIDGVTPAARRALLVAGVTAAGLLGMAAAHVGPGPTMMLVVGAGVLVAASSSSYAALAILIVLLPLPLRSFSLPPFQINQIDIVYASALIGLALRVLVNKERFAVGSLGLAALAFLASGSLSALVGVLNGAGLQGALSHFRGIFGYALIPLLFLSLGGEQASRRRALLLLLCGVGALTAARGVLSWAQLNGLVELGGVLHRLASPDSTEAVGAVPALAGDFGYVRAWAGNLEGNTLGAFVILIAPVAVAFALRAERGLARLAFGAGALLLVMALIVSYSRGAYLGLSAAALPALLVLWQRRPVLAVAVALGGVILVGFLVTQLPGADDRLVTVYALREDPTVQHRQLVYEHVVDAIALSPAWGTGLGTDVPGVGTGADSLYLFVLLRGGLLMAAATFALIVVAGRRVLGALRAGNVGGLDLAVAAALWGFAVHSAFDYSLWNPKVALTAWLLAGALLAAALEGRARETRVPAAEPGSVVRSW
ncbi:MAG: O-antigen ligase family protein [Dehalococcoidia bacterium]|nr:O-antigen ligase family protein [Dehalococcoidia bacterium]